MRLLLVEDEHKLSDALVSILEDSNYSVDAVYDGESGQDMAASGIYDIIILDRLLPCKEGLQVLRELRSKGIQTPVLLLTAKDTVEDRVDGLDAGADDYLVKPFNTKELLARVRALSRRSPEQNQTDKMQVGSLVLDILRCEAITNKEAVKLTLKECKLLELLIRKKDYVITKEQILDKVWGLDSVIDMNNIETYIHFLRKKLNSDDCGIQIETIRGVGYCLKENLNVS